MGQFWLCLFFSMAVGTMVGLVTGESYDPTYFLHDILTYPILAAISCIMVAGTDAAERLQSVADLVIWIGIFPLCIMLVVALGGISVPSINPWFWERFQGWSDNPNQLALMALVLLLVALFRYETALTFGGRARAVLCLLLAAWVGRLSQSDSFTFAALTAGLVFCAMTMRAWMRSRESPTPVRTAAAWIGVVLLPAFLISLAPSLLFSGNPIASAVTSLTKNGGKDANHEADLRLGLWKAALRRGFETGMLGLGPGPHLPMPSEIAADHVNAGREGLVNHPLQGAAANFEAHNTALDLFTEGGFLLVAAFACLIGRALYGVFRAGNKSLTAMLWGLTVFGSTGLICRHPLFWFAIAICLAACDPASTEVRRRLTNYLPL
ncbi:MAG: O-antigen ligase family protein [Rhodopila sp.]|jgi:O-antigen ligase